MKPIIIFYHAFLTKDYKNVMQEQLTKVFSAGLYDACEKLVIGVTYTLQQDLEWVKDLVKDYEKIELVIHEKNKEEKSTLSLLLNEAKKKDCYLCYFHMKGIHKNEIHLPDISYNIITWRRIMDYYILTNWSKCIEKLSDGYDAVGILKRHETFLGYHPHYSGGYWWTTSENILSLDSNYIISDSFSLGRFGAEFWIGSNKFSKMACLYDFNGIEPAEQEHKINLYINNKIA